MKNVHKHEDIEGRPNECRLLDYQPKGGGSNRQRGGEGDYVHDEDNGEDVESDVLQGYLAMKRMMLITHTRLEKGFGVSRVKTIKSRTNQKIIRRQFLRNKEGHKKRDKRLVGHEV